MANKFSLRKKKSKTSKVIGKLLQDQCKRSEDDASFNSGSSYGSASSARSARSSLSAASSMLRDTNGGECISSGFKKRAEGIGMNANSGDKDFLDGLLVLAPGQMDTLQELMADTTLEDPFADM